jgi:guanylate kinase
MASIFILPPTGKALERRLKTRAQDSDEVVARRLAAAAAEITHWVEYDYVIVNADLDASFAQLAAILAAERHKRARQAGLAPFVQGLLADL